jgi:hypothetical protein
MLMLQRFLQPFSIMRSRDVLNPSPCKQIMFPVRMGAIHAQAIADFVEQYRKAVHMEDGEKKKKKNSNKDGEEGSSLVLAVRAQMYVLHPKLVPKKAAEEHYEPNFDDLANVTNE